MRLFPCPDGAAARFFSTMLLAAAMAVHGQQQKADLEPSIVERGDHHRVLQSGSGKDLKRRVQLETGMHYRDADGSWKETQELVELVQGGAAAVKGPHKVFFSANINSIGSIRTETVDGTTLRTHVVAIGFFDRKSGEYAILSPVKDSIGTVVNGNQVIYEDAFAELKADVRYSYTKRGLEQDVILRQQPPAPEEFGFDSKTTQLEVWTEFPQTPAVKVSARVAEGEKDGTKRAVLAEPDVFDETVQVGEMRIGAGHAFPDNQDGKGGTVPVAKRWLKVQGRQMLIEQVPWPRMESSVKKLPQSAAVNRVDKKARVYAQRSLPSILPNADAKPADRFLMASAERSRSLLATPGYVVDFLLSSSLTNFTFAGDSSYEATGPVVLSQTTTIEGGAVVHYSTGAYLQINDTIVCDTSPYRPAVFLSVDDGSMGTGGSGSPGGTRSAARALWAPNPVSGDLHDLKIFNATTAVEWSGSGRIYNLQIKQCDNGIIWHDATGGRIHNVLMSGVVTAFGGDDTSLSVQHFTGYYIDNLTSIASGSLLDLKNCIFVNLTSPGPEAEFDGDLITGRTIAVDNGPAEGIGPNLDNVMTGTVEFDASGSGADFYLAAESSLRDVGETDIDSALAEDLKKLTTFAPTVKDSTVSSSAVWGQTVQRDSDTPDLGYHYAPLDYILRGATLSGGVTVVLTNGAAAGIDYSAGSWGMVLGTGSAFISEGSPLAPNHLLQAHAVQENSGGRPGTRACFYANGSDASAYYRARFTESSQISDDGYWIYGVANFGQIEWTHSRNYNQWTILELSTSSSALLGVTNTLWNRGSFYVDARYGSAGANVRNIYFRKSFNWMFNGYGTYNVHDSILDSLMNFYVGGMTVNNGYNAYSPTNASTFSGGSNNQLVPGFGWQTGPLGSFYLTNASPLLNAGSTVATNVGLYHFTTTTNQWKETNSVVDIGMHYVAVATNGFPWDLDGDGIADFREDRNGNGSTEGSETSFLEADSDLDGINDSEELVGGTDPLNASSTTLRLLASFRFNGTSLVGDQGQIPRYTLGLTSASGLEGSSVPITGTAGSRILNYRTVEQNGRPNISFTSGTVSFWFKPNWASRSKGGAGPDPEAVGRFFNLGEWSDPPVQSFWSLFQYDYHDASGTVIGFNSYTNGAAYGAGAAMAHFRSNQWHQIVLTYSPSNVSTWIDGTNAASASGCTIVPDKVTRDYGFLIGSDTGGNQQAQGSYDLLETFNYPLSSSQVASNYLHVLNSGQGFGARTFRPSSATPIP